MVNPTNKAADAAVKKAGLEGKGSPFNNTVCGRFIKTAGELDYKEGFAYGKAASYQKAYNGAYDRGLYSV